MLVRLSFPTSDFLVIFSQTFCPFSQIPVVLRVFEKMSLGRNVLGAEMSSAETSLGPKCLVPKRPEAEMSGPKRPGPNRLGPKPETAKISFFLDLLTVLTYRKCRN